MKKFIFKILLFFLLPIAAIAIIAEYSVRKVPNDYSYKNQWMEKNSKNIQILCLGPSSLYYGINPQYFEKKAFNGSHLSQSLNYDNFVFNKFIDKMDSLQYLVLDIDYWSPFSSLESSLEWWRAKYYSIYYGCNYHNGELKYNYELAVHNSKTFHTAFEGLENELNIADVSNINVTELGFGVKYSSKLRVENWDHGKINAIQHTEWIESQAHLKLIEKNRAFVQDIVNKCVERHIKVLLISTPTYETYNTNRDKKYLKIKDDFCKSFVSPTKNVIFSDFSEDNRFGKADFFDAYHLNEIGAKKLTLILNNKISNLN